MVTNGYRNARLGQRMANAVIREITSIKQAGVQRTHQIVLEAIKMILNCDHLSLLDVGCGVGLYREVLRQYDSFVDYEGADFNETMIARAQGLFPETKFHLADARLLPFDDDSYDVVLAGAILEHIKEWRRALDEICRVAEKHLILHRTLLIAPDEPTRTERQIAFGEAIWRVYIDKRELIHCLARRNFVVSDEWFVAKDGNKGAQWTFLCRRTNAT